MADSIRFLSDDALRITGVTNNTDPNSKAALTGATVTGRLYDEAASAPLTVAAAENDTTLTVADASIFTVGDTVALWLDNATIHEAAIDSINTTTDALTIDTAIPASRSARVGAWVRTKLGGDITMTSYGTPAADDHTWGYQGTLADAHADLRPKMNVRVEVNCDGGADLRLLKARVYRVIEDG